MSAVLSTVGRRALTKKNGRGVDVPSSLYSGQMNLAQSTQGPWYPQSKVIFGRYRQLLAINAHKMAPSTGRWLQERVWDAPTKGLQWCWSAGVEGGDAAGEEEGEGEERRFDRGRGQRGAAPPRLIRPRMEWNVSKARPECT